MATAGGGRRAWAPGGAARGRAGMTLIEIMVVVVIMALMVTGVGLGVGALPRSRLRTSAVRMASTFRFAYVHALTTGRTTRGVLPMGRGDLRVEDTDDAHTLDARDPLAAGGAEAVEARAERESRLMTDLRPRAPRATFAPLPARVFRARSLEPGVRIARLYSQHDAEPREEGTGHVYFFAGGRAERAVVHLSNARGEIYSVVLSPLTGRAEVFDRPVEPPVVEDRDTSDQTEVDAREREVQEMTP